MNNSTLIGDNQGVTTNYLNLASTVCGYIGTGLVMIGNLPQIWTNYKKKNNPVGVAMTSIFAFSGLAFSLNLLFSSIENKSLPNELIPLMIANVLSVGTGGILLAQKYLYRNNNFKFVDTEEKDKILGRQP